MTASDAGSARPATTPREPVALLASVRVLEDLDGETTAALAARAQRRELVAEAALMREGEPSEGLAVVASGWLKGTTFAPSGREQVLHYFGPGDALNEVSLFVEAPNAATVVALEPAVVWVVPRRVLSELAERRPDVLWPLTRNLAQRLLHVVGLVQDLTLLPLEGRLAKWLLEHAEGDVFERPAWATQAELAHRLGTVPDVLHRALRGLVRDGVLKVERKRIVILDRDALQARLTPR